MSLIFTLASRNLIHDWLRFVATVVGIVFSIVLVTVQMGFIWASEMVTTMIDHSSADLWIMPTGTKCFESVIAGRAQAISSAGDQWRDGSDAGRDRLCGLAHADRRINAGLHRRLGSAIRALPPWNLVDGSIDDLTVPNTVAVDQSYFDRLGFDGVGTIAEIRGQKVQVAAVSKGIRSFTTTPYVFTLLDRARAYTGTAPNKATYFLARVAPGIDVENVRSRLKACSPKSRS